MATGQQKLGTWQSPKQPKAIPKAKIKDTDPGPLQGTPFGGPTKPFQMPLAGRSKKLLQAPRSSILPLSTNTTCFGQC